jgi:tetratricopeptide (TPR) repeat protein
MLFVFAQQDDALNRLRVAVTIFENQTGDSSLDYLSRETAEWIAQGISQVAWAELAPIVNIRSELHNVDGVWLVEKIGDATKAEAVISGTIHKQGDSLRFHTKITNVTNNEVVFALDPATGPTEDPFASIEEMRQRIMGAMWFVLKSEYKAFIDDTGKPPTYASLKELWEGHMMFGEDYEEAIKFYEKSLSLDPYFNYAKLRIGIALYNLEKYDKSDSVLQHLEMIRDRLSRYNRSYLDMQLAIIKGDLPGELRAARERARIIHKNPAAQYQWGLVALQNFRINETLQVYADHDPEDSWFWYWNVLTLAYHHLGEHEQELEKARQGRKQYPEYLEVLNCEARALAVLGYIEELDKVLTESFTTSSRGDMTPGTVITSTAHILAARGYDREASDVLKRAIGWYKSRPESEIRELRSDIYEALYCSVIWGDESLTNKSVSLEKTISDYFVSEDEDPVKILQFIAGELYNEDSDNIDNIGRSGTLAARLDNREEALRLFRILENIDDPYARGENIAWQARITAVMGEKDRAITLWQDAFRKGYAIGLEDIYHPDLDNLREYKPFQEFIKPRG